MFGFLKVFADAAGVATAGGAAATQGAQNAAGAGAGGGIVGAIVSMFPLILMLVLMYVVMILPQRKREKKLKAQIDAMKIGDKIVTIGGICGKVTKLKDEYVYIETGNVGTPDEKSVIKMERSAIKTVETIHN